AYPGIKFKGQYFAIEATGIGGEGLGKISSSEEALQMGFKQLQEFFVKAQEGDPRYSIIDINPLIAQGVEPMNLTDDDFLKGKVDKLAENFSATQQSQTIVQYVNASNTASNTSNTSNQNSSNSGLSFSKPNGWQVYNHPVANMPILTAQVVSPDQLTVVNVYDIPASSTQEGMQIINQYFNTFGMYAQYQINGNTISGQTSSNNGMFNWVAKSVRSNTGIRIVAVGSPDYAYNQKSNEINNIFNSIR